MGRVTSFLLKLEVDSDASFCAFIKFYLTPSQREIRNGDSL